MSSRPLCRIGFLAVVVFVGVSVLWSKHSHARDPWYNDMSKHWSEQYVRMLWSEDVADGYVSTRYLRRDSERYRKTTSVFKPDEEATRAHHALLMAKVFRLLPFDNPVPTYKDLPRDYAAYPGKPGYGYVEAAHKAGLLYGKNSNLFRPDAAVFRQDAVASLVKSLGLESYALSLAVKDVNRLLERFKDQKAIDASIRPHMATAARLKIIEGYPDGTFKPTRHMTRAEAATVVYRSCLIRADALPNTFFPGDANAPDNHTDVTLFSLKNSNARAWSLSFRDLGDKIVASFGIAKSGRAGVVEVPQSVTWDGADSKGRVLPHGTYFYQASVVDTQGQVHSSVPKPVTIAERGLRASLSPSSVSYLEVVEVRANTTGWAKQVLATTSTGASIALQPAGTPSSYSNSWVGSFVVSSQVTGFHTVETTAIYDIMEKNQVLTYEVRSETSPSFPDPPSNPLEQVVFTLID